MGVYYKSPNVVHGIGDDGVVRPSTIDIVSGGMLVMTDSQHHIHSAEMWAYFDNLSLGASGSQDYLFTTPAAPEQIHIVQTELAHTALLTVSFFEGSDKVGTALQTPRNKNRNGSDTTDVIVHKGVSGGTTDGILLDQYVFGTAAGGASVGGGSLDDSEWVLKPSTKYLVRYLSGGTAQVVALRWQWYQHIPKT